MRRAAPGVRRPPAERGYPGPGSGRAALKRPGRILPEGNGVRACPALGAFFVWIVLGQPTGILLPAGAAAGHGSGRAAGLGSPSGLGAGGRAAFAGAGDAS